MNRITINGPIYDLNNDVIAWDGPQFWSLRLLHAIDYDENGVPVATGSPVWTGTAFGGMTTAAACNGWLNPNLVGARQSATPRTRTLTG